MSYELPIGRGERGVVGGPSVVPYGPRMVRAEVRRADEVMNGSPLTCTWRGKTVSYSPSAVTISPFHTVDLIHGAIPWFHDLKMTEHFAAISQLTSTAMNILFQDGEVPYSMKAVGDLCKSVFDKRQIVTGNHHVTLDLEEPWEFHANGQDIIIEPHDSPELIVTGEFDFSGHPHLDWIGKQRATLNTGTKNKQELLSFAQARSPIADIQNELLIRLLKKLGRDTVESCILRSREEMSGANEVAKHKILDFLCLLNLNFYDSDLPLASHPYFLAARILIRRLGHKQGIIGAQKLESAIATKKVGLRLIESPIE